MREIIGDALIIALGLILIVHFGLFWYYGWIRIGEPSRIILGIETVMALAILYLGIDRFRDDIRRMK